MSCVGESAGKTLVAPIGTSAELESIRETIISMEAE